MRTAYGQLGPLILTLLTVFGLVLPAAAAQTEVPTPTVEPGEPGADQPSGPPTHLVQEGETLISIAELYGTSVEVLQRLNQIQDPSLLYAGQELLLPGGQGGIVFTTHVVQLGDSLPSLAADFASSVTDIALANRLINPHYLVAGQMLTILSHTGSTESQPITGLPHVVQLGDTPLTVAAQYGLSPNAVAAANDLSYPAHLFSGQRLRIPGPDRFQSLPGPWRTVRAHPLPAVQGETLSIYVESLWPGVPEGQLAGQALHFAPYEDGFVSLVGLDAFTEPGSYPLTIGGTGDRPWRPIEQEILVASGNYGTQQITIPDDLIYLLDPAIRAEEDQFLATIYSRFSELPLWSDVFRLPVDNGFITAGYGGARSYNEGPIEIYHTGTDFAGAVGTPIYSPAAGTVIFSDTLQLRGTTLILDHGLGVMTGYYHLSKVHVQVGDAVSAGQLLAEGGSTGLSSGPHLHWDVRIRNVPVNGLQWTREPFP